MSIVTTLSTFSSRPAFVAADGSTQTLLKSASPHTFVWTGRNRGGGTVDYVIDWGDGGATTTGTATGTATFEISETHAYNSLVGSPFTITATVTDDKNLVQVHTIALTVFSAPAKPTITSAVASATLASNNVAITPGATNNSAIVNYEYRIGSGSYVQLSPADANSPVTIPGLVAGNTLYVKAINAAGAGNGTASDAYTVIDKPTAPTGVAATALATGNVTFTGASDNGSALTKYQYSIDAGTTWLDTDSPTDTVTPITIAALNTSDVLILRAVNAVGNGPASTPVTVTAS